MLPSAGQLRYFFVAEYCYFGSPWLRKIVKISRSPVGSAGLSRESLRKTVVIDIITRETNGSLILYHIK